MVNFSLFKLLIFCSISIEIYFLLPWKYFAFAIDPENPFLLNISPNFFDTVYNEDMCSRRPRLKWPLIP